MKAKVLQQIRPLFLNRMKDDNENETEKKEKILVTHGTGVYDVTTFSNIHPGGSKYLQAFNKKVKSHVFPFFKFIDFRISQKRWTGPLITTVPTR